LCRIVQSAKWHKLLFCILVFGKLHFRSINVFNSFSTPDIRCQQSVLGCFIHLQNVMLAFSCVCAGLLNHAAPRGRWSFAVNTIAAIILLNSKQRLLFRHLAFSPILGNELGAREMSNYNTRNPSHCRQIIAEDPAHPFLYHLPNSKKSCRAAKSCNFPPKVKILMMKCTEKERER
jgi:hypothetical protein